jgi:NAD(P)-dependent dehydrogenase (short-subunit alcohol dehydrogenase family)
MPADAVADRPHALPYLRSGAYESSFVTGATLTVDGGMSI